MKKYLTLDNILTVAIYLALFLSLVYPYRDFDWGWHYKYGEYFFTNGQILRLDPFSWTTPGYRWVNHSWLYDPFMYLLFKSFSFTGISFMGGLVMLAGFIFLIKPYNLKYWQIGLLAFPYYKLTSGVAWQGMRSQMFGLLFICLLLYLLAKARNRLWVPFLLPPFFLLWANLHGSFSFGLIIYATYAGTNLLICLFTKNKIPKYLIYLLAAFPFCIAITFINPFGASIYNEVLRHSSNKLLGKIIEWEPVEFLSGFYAFFISYTLSALGLVIYISNKFKKDKTKNFPNYLPYLLIASFGFIMASTARRYMPIFVIATIPLVSIALKNLDWQLEKYKATLFIAVIAITVTLEICLFQRLPGIKPLSYNFEDYCRLGAGCSPKATNYLSTHPPNGLGFNFYDWGGYLIGHDFPTKLFIDGRMHLWKTKEGFEPFADYFLIYYQQDLRTFRKYNFDWIFIPTNSQMANTIKNNKEYGHWKVQYEDEKAVYFVRKN